MELLIKIISILLILLLISLPILVLFKLEKSNLKYNFISYLVVSIILTFILVLISAWWGYLSQKILLTHYGYNFEAMNDLVRFQKVAIENLERVQRFEKNMLGIGWPAKAFIIYVFYFPYILVVYLISYFLKKYKRKRKYT